MSDSFYLETNGTYNAGDVVALGGHRHAAFMTAVVLGFNKEGRAKVSRPYAYASGVGTCGPTPLLGCETFECTLNTKFDPILEKGKIA